MFYADVDGEFVPVTSGGVSRPENASQSRNFGIELGATWLAARWLDVSASYTFSDFRLLDYATALVDSTGTLQPVVYNDKLMPTIPRSRITAEVVTRPLRHSPSASSWSGRARCSSKPATRRRG